METKQFLAEFGHVAHAPEGIARLRELIYQLAVTGRLTSQIEKDGDADDILNNVARIRQQLIAGKKYKRSPKLESSNIVPPAIDLPLNWRWSRLLDLGEINPRNQAGEEVMATFVPMAGVSEKHSKEISGELKPWSEIHKGYTHFANGDVLLAKITPCFENGKAAVVSGLEHNIGAGSTEFHVFRSISQFVHPGYVYLFLRSPLFRAKGEACMTGTAGQKRLPTDYFALCAMPLPPTAEQSRIVAKVDELIALCDKLEAQQQASRKMQNNLCQSMLQAVARATNSQELQTSWTRLSDNFGRLFHAPEDVDKFVAELRNIAVRGLLSLPSTSLSPVDGIMGDCDSLRGQYISSGLMRRQKLISVADSDVVYPEHWAIAPFDKVAVVIGGVTKGRDLRGRDVMTCPYLAVANVQRGFFRLTDLKTIQIGKQELNKYLVQEGDLLITEGGDWDTVGRTAIWRGGVDNCLHQNHVFKARVPSLSLLNEWVELVFNSGIGRDYFAGASKQTTNLASINMTQLRSFPMPIPPLDEQRTVLAKLDALTKQADIWRKKLESKKHLALLLASATVATFTGLTIEQEEEPMKAPQTELIATLRLGKAPDIKAQAPLATILARHHGEMSAKDLWQRFGGEIDAFYAQLKIEVVHGWILEPAPAEVREKPADRVSA